jgi:hypothetical protein
MADKLRAEDDVAFTITTGYYPKIASSVHYALRQASRGSTGSKYSQIEGWSEYSLKKAAYEKPKGYEGRLRDDRGRLLPEIKAHRKSLFEGQRGTAETAAKGGLKKGKLPKLDDREIQRKDYRPETYKNAAGEDVPWPKRWNAIENYKWIGGSSQYKLYGDQAWYMHGKAPGGGAKVMEEFLEGLSKGKKGQQKIAPAFQNIYSNTEPQLTKKAMAMADKVFEGALREIEKSAEEVMLGDYGAGSTEEIGFETDEYKYLPFSTAKGAKENGNFLYRDQLDEMVSGSHANPRDMVKIHKDTGRIEQIFDVTDMPLGKKGQHGIMETPPELLKAIEDAKSGGNLKELRQQVETMFIKAIKNDYNKTIQRIKKSTEAAYKERTGGKQRRTTNFQQVINEIRQETGKWKKSGKKGRVTVKDVGNFANMKLVDHARRAHYKNAFSETGLKYVTHMLASWGQKAGNDYTQAHSVASLTGVEHKGQSIFAYTKMHQYGPSAQKAMEFSETAPKGEKNTFLAIGYNSTMALEALDKKNKNVNWRLRSLAQKRAWTHRWITGNNIHTSLGQIKHGISNHAGGKVQNTTQVFLPQRQDMNKFLQSVIDTAVTKGKAGLGTGWKAKAEKLLPNLQSQLEHNRYSFNPAKGGWKNKLRRGGDMNQPAFWALPYLGIMTSEHIERTAAKKKTVK